MQTNLSKRLNALESRLKADSYEVKVVSIITVDMSRNPLPLKGFSLGNGNILLREPGESDDELELRAELAAKAATEPKEHAITFIRGIYEH